MRADDGGADLGLTQDESGPVRYKAATARSNDGCSYRDCNSIKGRGTSFRLEQAHMHAPRWPGLA